MAQPLLRAVARVRQVEVVSSSLKSGRTLDESAKTESSLCVPEASGREGRVEIPMSESQQEKDDHAEGDALLDLLARGTELTRRLVDETARLRRRLAEGASSASDGASRHDEQQALGDWIAKIDTLQRENRSLLEQLRSVEASNQLWAERHAEIEERHNELANLYVASYQLHATFDPEEVIAAISEIVINLIGAEVFALYSCNPGNGCLTPVACEGRPLASFPTLTVGSGIIGETLVNRRVYVAEPGAGTGEGEPVVVIPLHMRESALGAIALYKLLDQKAEVSELDHQLFGLLASHAATALVCSRWVAAPVSMPGSNPDRIDRVTN